MLITSMGFWPCFSRGGFWPEFCGGFWTMGRDEKKQSIVHFDTTDFWIVIPSSSKKQPSCQTHCEETCMPPFPQFNVVTSLCFERPSKKTAISVRMPACIGQQHWSRGRGGIRYDVTTCRRMAVFFEEPGEDFLAYGCANTGLNQFPFAFAKTSIQAHSQLQTCYPPNKDATDLFFSFMDVQTQAWTNSLLHVPKPQFKHTFIFRAATHKQRSNIAAFAPHVGKNWRSELRALHGALM